MDYGQGVSGLFEFGAQLVVEFVANGADVDVGKDVGNALGCQASTDCEGKTTCFATIHNDGFPGWEQPVPIDSNTH